jgi:hypothetical protein
MECGSRFIYIKKTVNKKHLFAFVPSRCKSWSCPDCRPIKAKIVRDYIKKNFKGDNTYMLSLTFYHSGNALDSWKKLGKCWNLMRTYCVSRFGKFNYIRIVEPHKNGGWPHLHILIDKFIVDQKVVKKVTEWGFGWNMHNVHVDPVHAANYVSKYLTNKKFDADADVLRVASKCRIVSVSRGMPPIFSSESEWECVKYDVPNNHAEFMHSKIVDELIDKGCVAVYSRPYFGGFIIESDIDVNIDWCDDKMDPYVERRGKGYLYEYMPNGLQLELLFNDP